MTVGDLLKEIKRCQKEYSKDFLEWEVYTEQTDEKDKKYKRKEQGWKIVKDSEGWEYFKCCGFSTIMPNKKIFTININY